MSPSAASPDQPSAVGWAVSWSSTRSKDWSPWVAPVEPSGRLRSESTPVSWMPGASVPLTLRSSDWRSMASWLDPKSTASVLLPLSTSAAPAGATPGSRPVAGRGTVAGAPEGAAALSAVACGAGRALSSWSESGGGASSQHAATSSVSPGTMSRSTRSSPRSGSST